MYTNQNQLFRLNVDVHYGKLNIFGLGAVCQNGNDLYSICTVCSPCNITNPPLNSLSFSYRIGAATGLPIPGSHRLQAEASYFALLALLVNLQYQSLPDVNSALLRSRAPKSASDCQQPYETADYTVQQRQPNGTFVTVGGISVLIRIAEYTSSNYGSLPLALWTRNRAVI